MFSWFGVTILRHRDNETDHRDIQWHNGPNQSNLMSTKLSSRSECSLPINKSLKEFMDWKGMDLVSFELACVSELISIEITDVIIMMIRTISSYEQYHHMNNVMIWTIWCNKHGQFVFWTSKYCTCSTCHSRSIQLIFSRQTFSR